MKTSEVVFVVIPAYNEEENIYELVKAWYAELQKVIVDDEDFRMIIIDDGSNDNTYEILCKLIDTYPKLVPISKSNSGHGATLLFGYSYAINNGADWIFQTDSDGQTNPMEFVEFWNKRTQYDAIIGNRLVRGDGKGRKFVENVVCFILRIIFGISVNDANAPFRLMRTSLVKKYINKLPENYNLPNIMFTTYFVYNKEKILFLPISFKPREKGTNSINLKKIIAIGWRAIGDFKKLKKEIDV